MFTNSSVVPSERYRRGPSCWETWAPRQFQGSGWISAGECVDGAGTTVKGGSIAFLRSTASRMHKDSHPPTHAPSPSPTPQYQAKGKKAEARAPGAQMTLQAPVKTQTQQRSFVLQTWQHLFIQSKMCSHQHDKVCTKFTI